MYGPHDAPKMYRGGKMTGAAFVRESRRLSHAIEGAHFVIAMARTEAEATAHRLRLASLEDAQSALHRAYRESR